MPCCQPREREDNRIMIAALTLFFMGLPVFLLGLTLMMPSSWVPGSETDGYYEETILGMILICTGGFFVFLAGILWVVLVCRAKSCLWRKYFNPKTKFAKTYFLYSLAFLVTFLVPAITLAVQYNMDFDEHPFYSYAAIFYFCLFGATLVPSVVALFSYIKVRPLEKEQSTL